MTSYSCAWQWRKLYHVTEWTNSWPRCQVSAAFSRRLQYTNFVLQRKNAANETTDKCVRTFDARCRDTQSASDQLQLCELSGPTSRFTVQEFSMVGDYIEDLEKPQNCQNWGVGSLAHTCNNGFLCPTTHHRSGWSFIRPSEFVWDFNDVIVVTIAVYSLLISSIQYCKGHRAQATF